METVAEVLSALKKKGSEQTRKTFARHGAPQDSFFGVKVADLKVIAKQIKGQQELACELYDSGNADAMYLAGLVADGALMTRRQLEGWARGATWHMLSEYTVPWVVCESTHAHDLAMKWIGARKELTASTGWCTYAGLLALQPDDELDLSEIEQLLKRVVEQIDAAPNRVRYTMNGFVISVGTCVKPLLKQARDTAKQIGTVSVDSGETACKVPLASEVIAKAEAAGRVGNKRKTIKC